jgi:APA family basic amino acid/polyamine antiporter
MDKAVNRPKIGLVSSIAFAVGTMIGAGVFVLSGPAIASTGPAALLSYCIAGLSVLFSALSFSVVSSLAPAGASGFAYVRTLFGPFWGFITSWAFYIGGVIGCAFILNGFGVYVQQFFLPHVNPIIISLVAAVFLTLLNLGPASAIGKAEVVLVGIKILALIVFILMGVRLWNTIEFSDFVRYGWPSVFHESGQLFVAFLGFSVVCSMAGDIRNAPSTIPLAILLSMLIVTVIYAGVIMSLLAAHLQHYNESSIGTASGIVMGRHGPVIIAIAALVSILSCANANILGCSETMVRLAGKGEVPTFLGKMYNGHPAVSVLCGAVIYIGLILLGQTENVVSYTNISTISMLIIINIAAFFALRKKLIYKRIYPFSMLIPFLGLSCGVGQLFMMDLKNVIIGTLFVASGSVLFLLRKKYHVTEEHRSIKRSMENLNGPLSRALKEDKSKAEPISENS